MNISSIDIRVCLVKFLIIIGKLLHIRSNAWTLCIFSLSFYRTGKLHYPTGMWNWIIDYLLESSTDESIRIITWEWYHSDIVILILNNFFPIYPRRMWTIIRRGTRVLGIRFQSSGAVLLDDVHTGNIYPLFSLHTRIYLSFMTLISISVYSKVICGGGRDLWHQPKKMKSSKKRFLIFFAWKKNVKTRNKFVFSSLADIHFLVVKNRIT